MRRDQLEHVIRAASAASGGDEIVVVGSQAILGEHPVQGPALLRSMGADVYPRAHPERAVAIDAAIGDGSRFHETFGYYANGVGPETARAPGGWEGRLVRVDVDLGASQTATGWCLEGHDLVLAKLAAGRERDHDFARDALAAGLVRRDELTERAAAMVLTPGERERLDALLAGSAAS